MALTKNSCADICSNAPEDLPTKVTVGPITIGGNTFCRILGGVKDKRTSRSAVNEVEPSSAPYPSGQGRWAPSASVGHIPELYICCSAEIDTLTKLKDVPTTHKIPVPR